MNEFATILGTAVAVSASMGAAGLFVLRLVISNDVRPLGEQMIRLGATMDGLTGVLSETKAEAKAHACEIREILTDLNKLVGDHETRLQLLEQPPRPPAASRKRAA